MSFDLTGRLIAILPIQTFAKGFKKREFVLETTEKYPQKLLFTLKSDKVDMINSFAIGDTITVAFEITGREWADAGGAVKYFSALEAWRLIGEKRAPVTASQQSDDDILNDLFPDNTGKSQIPEARYSQPVEPGNENDDLPF